MSWRLASARASTPAAAVSPLNLAGSARPTALMVSTPGSAGAGRGPGDGAAATGAGLAAAPSAGMPDFRSPVTYNPPPIAASSVTAATAANTPALIHLRGAWAETFAGARAGATGAKAAAGCADGSVTVESTSA